MKKIQQIVIVSLILLLLGACVDKFEKDVFSQGPSERIQESINKYHQILQSSANGWVMQYYPDGSSRRLGGYNYILKFTKEEVTAFLVEASTNEVTSKYAIIPNGGATLSFDDYNEALHFFAQPSDDQYQGNLGDYEFLFVSYEDGVITLKGKKYGNIARLVKIEEPSSDYLNKLQDVSSRVFSIAKLLVNNEEENISAVDIQNVLFISPNQDEKDKQVAYVATHKGIRFYNPITLAGNSYQEFELNVADNTLVSADGKVKFFLAYRIPFDVQSNLWLADVRKTSDNSAKFIEEWRKANDLNQLVQNAPIAPRIGFGYFDRDKGTSIVLIVGYNGSNPQYIASRFAVYTGTLVQGEVQIQLGAGATNWTHFGHLQPFMDFIQKNSPYQTQLDDPTNPTKVKLTSTKDTEVWFTLEK